MSERQWVTVGLFALCGAMLLMAYTQRWLWEVKLFEVVLQAVVLTGLLNMVTAFHFAANQQSQQATQNTSDAFRTIQAVAAKQDVQTVQIDQPADKPVPVEETQP